VLLPVVLAARFQEQALLCRADSDLRSPADLAGRRVAVRAYSQTTGLWLRGIIEDQFGVSPDKITWVTQEGAHVTEFADPPWVTRVDASLDLMAMLHAGDVDAVIMGNDIPNDPRVRTVIADTKAAGDVFWERNHVVPVNHMVAITSALAEGSPDVVAELLRLFATLKAASPTPAGAPDPRPFGRPAVDAGVALALRYATAQGLLPKPLTIDDVWAGSPA
jgi:4,5-dihydroxyphthalate decarboxylase